MKKEKKIMAIQNKLEKAKGKDFIHLQWFSDVADEAVDDAGSDGGDDQADGTVEPESNLAGWTSIFPKEDREKYKDVIKSFEKPKDLLANYIELSKKQERAILQPGEDATEEEKRAYLKALGVPEDVKGYELPKMNKELAGQLGDVKSFNEWFASTAHALDMTKAQAEGFYKKYVEALTEKAKESADEIKAQAAERAGSLKKEWGDKTDGNFELARRAFRQFADDEFSQFMAETHLAEDPRMIKVFYNISQKISDDTHEPGSLTGDEPEEGGLKYPHIREKYGVSQE